MPRWVGIFAALTGAITLVMVVVVGTGRGGSDFRYGSRDQSRQQPLSRAEAEPLPLHTLPAFGNGDRVNLRTYRGEPLLVNFWASWCGPCVREMPMLRQVSNDLADDVIFLGINVQDSPINAEPFLDKLGVRYEQATDPTGDYFRAVGGIGMPTTLLVDQSGIIRYRHTGELDEGMLRELLKQHLGVAPFRAAD